jgi:hypothetical protein
MADATGPVEAPDAVHDANADNEPNGLTEMDPTVAAEDVFKEIDSDGDGKVDIAV